MRFFGCVDFTIMVLLSEEIGSIFCTRVCVRIRFWRWCNCCCMLQQHIFWREYTSFLKNTEECFQYIEIRLRPRICCFEDYKIFQSICCHLFLFLRILAVFIMNLVIIYSGRLTSLKSLLSSRIIYIYREISTRALIPYPAGATHHGEVRPICSTISILSFAWCNPL